MRYSISELLDSDHMRLQQILSDSALLESLYPQAIRPPDVSEVFTEWSSKPAGEGDLQLVARSSHGLLRGSVRLESNVLSYFVDPAHWGKGCGRFMMRWVARNVLTQRTGASFQAIVARQNQASIRLLESVGFVFSGMATEYQSSRTLFKYLLRT